MLCIFFFKQKTAYEMRISDWSSDVCSSDLVGSLCQADEEWRFVSRRLHPRNPAMSGERGKAQGTLPLDWGKGRRLLWVDGVNSAVMAHFVLMDDPDAIPIH